MKRTPSNAALAILLGGASFISSSAFAQDAGKPTPGAALQYVGTDTRLGVGIDSQNHARGELFQVLRGDDKSATLAEIWGSRNSGGAKLSHHWASGNAAVNKVFGAVDQGDKDLRKATLGGGQEYEKWFWNTYLSKGLSGARQGAVTSIATTVTQTGVDAGRPFEEDVTTTVTSRAFTRPYDWGVGARLGHFYEPSLVRLTAGLDYEWGKFSSRQWTGTLTAEKFFANSPISVAISGELFHRSGDFEGRRNDQRGMIMLRYELGAPQSSFRSSKVTRMVTATERVPDPSWRAPAIAVSAAAAAAPAAPTAAPAEPITRMEKRVTRANTNDAQETYFDLSSSKLKPAAFKELDALVGRISAQRPYVELKVNIVGHTCPTGGDRNNVLLSTKRAESVKAYLVSKGVPSELVTTSGEAGRSPKYPEVKGQSFRNRRTDTDVLIVREKVEDVRVTLPVAVAATTPPAAVVSVTPATATAAVAPMIERQVQREVVENVPNNWMSRALHNPAQHKTAVDTYRWVETNTAKSTGARRFLNRGPNAVNDAYIIECNAPVTFNVLANDSDPDGDALTITSVSTPGKGSASVSAGRVLYTPAASTCNGGALDSFTYTISDGRGGTSTATVTVTVKPAVVLPSTNNPPVAVDDVFTVPCLGSAVLDVLANDSDKDGDPLTIIAITQPPHAIISIGPNGKTLLYTPSGVCFSVDTFTYTISDGKGGTATAKVTLIDP